METAREFFIIASFVAI